MSTFININTLEFPLHEGDLRIRFRNIPEELTGNTFPIPEGYALVDEPSPEPEHDPEKYYCILSEPVYVEEADRWVRIWSDPIAFTEEELARMKENERQLELQRLAFEEEMRKRREEELNSLPGAKPDVTG